MSSRRAGRPPETSHDELRDLARALFAQHGFDATSLAEIARAAGISRTTLFAYFPAKRDLLWEEFDDREKRMREHLESAPAGPLVEVLADAMCVVAQYGRDEHEGFALRLGIVDSSVELRAYAALRTSELSATLEAFALSRAPQGDPALIGDVTHAMMAVAARATEDWARDPHPALDLDEVVADRLRPIAASLNGLLLR